MKEIDLQYSEMNGTELVVRQRTGAEVFAELKQRLESIGYLPDEYFLLDREWEDGRLIQLDADIDCSTDYGGSEGVYIDVFLYWNEEGNGVKRSHFITGKTPGESGTDLDRMFLVASAITKAFHGDSAQHERYVLVGGEPRRGSLIVGLTQEERRIFIESLIERRERMGAELHEIEGLLRRLTGSITDYINTVGHRPLDLDDHDRAVLAIRDGEWDAFLSVFPKLTERREELLIEAAGRAGRIGRRMMAHILAALDSVSAESYVEAGCRAVDTRDTKRIHLLMEQAASHVSGLDPAYYGKLLLHVISEQKGMTFPLVEQCRDEWIKNAPPRLLFRAVMLNQPHLASLLVKKGISAGNTLPDITHCMISGRREWELCGLLDAGLQVGRDDYRALDDCVSNRAFDAAKKLMERGVDFDGYCAWVRLQRHNGERKEIPDELTEYAAELNDRRMQEEMSHEQAG